MNKRSVIFCLLVMMCVASTACTSAAETDAYNSLVDSESQALAMNWTANPEATLRAYKDLLDAMEGFLDQYPSGEFAKDIQDRHEKLASTLSSLRAEFDAYQKAVKTEPADTNVLPSQCRRAAEAWQQFLARNSSSNFAPEARSRKQKWDERLQAEIKRGFQLVIEQADINQMKGAAQGREAGRPWDPQFFAEHAAPDPYVVLSVNDQAVAYTPVVRDSFHPHWNQKTEVLHISDDQQIVLLVRDRDVAENAASIVLGIKQLFTFGGLAAAQQALKADNDDDIGKWNGTIGDLLAKGSPASVDAGDFKNLRIRVIRP